MAGFLPLVTIRQTFLFSYYQLSGRVAIRHYYSIRKMEETLFQEYYNSSVLLQSGHCYIMESSPKGRERARKNCQDLPQLESPTTRIIELHYGENHSQSLIAKVEEELSY